MGPGTVQVGCYAGNPLRGTWIFPGSLVFVFLFGFHLSSWIMAYSPVKIFSLFLSVCFFEYKSVILDIE